LASQVVVVIVCLCLYRGPSDSFFSHQAAVKPSTASHWLVADDYNFDSPAFSYTFYGNQWGEPTALLFGLISVGYHSKLHVAIQFYWHYCFFTNQLISLFSVCILTTYLGRNDMLSKTILPIVLEDFREYASNIQEKLKDVNM
jgi:hypothetical protein